MNGCAATAVGGFSLERRGFCEEVGQDVYVSFGCGIVETGSSKVVY